MEQIYTIPVNEVFETSAKEAAEGTAVKCPFCRLYEKLEANEIELILGASMMEPDVRTKTNEQGFCERHLDQMFLQGKRLPLALILESHLKYVRESMRIGAIASLSGGGAVKKLRALDSNCYICNRIEFNFNNMITAAALMWQTDEEFKEKTLLQPYFCLQHYTRFLAAAKERFTGKEFSEFAKTVGEKETEYVYQLNESVSKFCKSFDYRYSDENMDDAKDAPERAKVFLKK